MVTLTALHTRGGLDVAGVLYHDSFGSCGTSCVILLGSHWHTVFFCCFGRLFDHPVPTTTSTMCAFAFLLHLLARQLVGSSETGDLRGLVDVLIEQQTQLEATIDELRTDFRTEKEIRPLRRSVMRGHSGNVRHVKKYSLWLVSGVCLLLCRPSDVVSPQTLVLARLVPNRWWRVCSVARVVCWWKSGILRRS